MKACSNKYVFKSPLVRACVRLFDLAGSLLFSFFRSAPAGPPYRKILAVRIDQLGDVAMTLPAVAALREAFPQARIDFLAAPWSHELVREYADETYVFLNSYFGGAVSWPPRASRAGLAYGGPSGPLAWLRCVKEWLGLACALRKNQYDLAIDFRGDLRNAALLFLAAARRRIGYGSAGGGFFYTDCLPEANCHQLERNLECVKRAGGRVAPEIPKLKYRRPEEKLWQDKMAGTLSAARRPWTVMHLGSGYPSKRWPASNFLRLSERLCKEEGGTVLLIGGEKEAALVRAAGWELDSAGMVNFMGKTSIEELCYLMDQSDCFVGNDSGPAHLAALLGKKTVVLFSGTNDWRCWQPRGSSVHVLHRDVPCSPCHARECRLARHDCMEDITVDEVLEKIREIKRAS